jgi:hypothetical protein
MAVHVATLVLVHVDSSTGTVFVKESANFSDFISVNNPVDSTPKTISTEFRILPDASIPNSAGYPTIKAYLEAENSGGFKFKHIDQTYVITES